MNLKRHSDVWMKAAVIGSVWGASEIVLGSFLHNLRIPFSGNLLAAIGIILMIAGHRIWPEKGLFWRAGLICAAMKTLSPSPFIFGPMLAIFMQSVLMQTGVLLGGRRTTGYLIGGGLAMSWNLVHRIITAVVMYGMSIVELYQSLVDYLYNNIALPVSGYWTPIATLFGLFFIGGITAAAAGILISRTAAAGTNGMISESLHVPPEQYTSADRGQRRFSVYRLATILVLLFGGLYVIYAYPIYISIIYVAAFITMIMLYDKRLIYRFIYKPGFWIGFLMITALTGFFLGGSPGNPAFTMDGVIIGIEMNLRAIVVVAGFGAVSVQLRNPVLIRWFENKRMKHFFSAIRISFQTIPFIIAAMPKGSAWRNPVSVLSGIIQQMNGYLEIMKKEERKRNIIFIITGKRGTGKTTTVKKIIRKLRDRGYKAGGIIQPEYLVDCKRDGYYVENAASGDRMPLCIRNKSSVHRSSVQFSFYDEAIAFGTSALSAAHLNGTDIVVIDEIGPIELDGKGWADAVTSLRTQRNDPMIWVIRDKLISDVIRKWNIEDYVVFDINYTDADTIAKQIEEQLGV
jgi:nucleoside-triphosphatase THEP1